MPKIPTYQRKLSIPGESGGVFQNVSSAGSEFGALAQAGKNLMDEADKTLSIIKAHQEKLRKQDIENKALLAASAYNEDQRIFRQSEEQQTGEASYQNMERGAKFRDDAIAKYTKDVSDPELKAKIQNHILSKSESLFDKLSTHQATQRQEVTKKAVEGIKSGLLKDAYDGDDLDDCIEEFQTTVKRQFQTGARGELSSIEEITKGESAIAEAHLDGLINRSPAAAIEAIKSGKYKQFLTQKQIEAYDKKAKELSEALKKDAETAKKEVDQATKERIKADREATGNEFVSRLVSGKLTRADVIKSNLEPTGENGKQYWMEQIQKKEDKAAKKSAVTVKTDPLFEKDIALSIFRAENASNKEEVLKNIKRAIVEGLISDKLNPDDANKYNKKIDELLNPKGQGGLTLTEKTQKDIMVERFNDAYKNGLFGEIGSDDGAREFLKQINAYEQWKESSESKGKDDIEYWEKIMKPYNEGFIKSLLSGKSAFKTLFGDDIDPVRRRKEGELLATEKRVSNTYVKSGNYDIKLTSEEVAMTKKQLIQRLQLKYNVPYSEAVNMVDEIRSGNIPVALEKTEKKVVGYSNGKPVYDLGNGQWQIGD